MSDDRLREIALLLRAIDDSTRERAEFLTAWKADREEIEKKLDRLKDDVLSGQKSLPLEPEPEALSGQNTLNN